MAKTTKQKADARAKQLEHLHPSETTGNSDGFLPDVPECVDAFPVLNALFTVSEIDGKKRIPATLTFWVEDCGLKAVLSDRHTKRKLWATATSVMGLLGELEAALTARNVDWRSDAGTKLRSRS